MHQKKPKFLFCYFSVDLEINLNSGDANGKVTTTRTSFMSFLSVLETAANLCIYSIYSFYDRQLYILM